MNIEKQLSFLVNKYRLKFSFQKFTNCYDGNWVVYTYSFYNENGCFTIHNIGQRDEWDYYLSKTISREREDLMETPLNIYAFEKDIWDKVTKKFFYTMKTEIKALAEVIETQIVKTGQFFGIKVWQ